MLFVHLLVYVDFHVFSVENINLITFRHFAKTDLEPSCTEPSIFVIPFITQKQIHTLTMFFRI